MFTSDSLSKEHDARVFLSTLSLLKLFQHILLSFVYLQLACSLRSVALNEGNFGFIILLFLCHSVLRRTFRSFSNNRNLKSEFK